MSISTWTTSNSKKIREFHELLKWSCLDWLKNKNNTDKPVHEFEHDGACEFCGELSKFGISSWGFSASVCPECFEKGKRGDLK